jgi:GNAT superfamily N-acetyltransferase
MNASLIRKPPVRAIASRNGTDELIAGYGDTWLMGIRLAQAAELSAVQEIDQASARMFNDVGMPQIAGMLWTAEDLAAYREAGRLWVITGLDDCPAGFLLTEMVDGCVHVEQVSVDPGSARRGLGRALLDHAAQHAAEAGVRALTLTTFAQVPWNAPYYTRCGFRLLGDAEVTPGLRGIRRRDAAFGLDQWPRVCMRREV